MSGKEEPTKSKQVRAAKAEAKETIGKLIGDDAAVEDARTDKAAATRGTTKNTDEQE